MTVDIYQDRKDYRTLQLKLMLRDDNIGQLDDEDLQELCNVVHERVEAMLRRKLQ